MKCKLIKRVYTTYKQFVTPGIEGISNPSLEDLIVTNRGLPILLSEDGCVVPIIDSKWEYVDGLIECEEVTGFSEIDMGKILNDSDYIDFATLSFLQVLELKEQREFYIKGLEIDNKQFLKEE